MPPAKKPAARSRAGSSPTKAVTRRDVERATARFEKALDDANKALVALGGDMGAGAKRAYRDIERALKALQRDAVKTNKAMLKDLEKLAAAVTPARPAARRSSTASRSKPAASQPAASKPAASTSAAAKAPARKAPARKPAGASTRSRAAAKK